MTAFRHVQFAKIALIASFGALGACQSTSTPTPVDTSAPVIAAPDETTGAGTFYPPATSFETPDIRFPQMAGVGPQQRQYFIDQVNLAGSTPGRTVPIVAQAVGVERQTLVFTDLDAEAPMTPYIARGILARLTSITRAAPTIAELGLSGEFDIYNMAAVLGFKRVIVTDGRDFAHEATLPDR